MIRGNQQNLIENPDSKAIELYREKKRKARKDKERIQSLENRVEELERIVFQMVWDSLNTENNN